MAPLSRQRLLGAALAGGLAVPGLAAAAAAPSGALSARPRGGPKPAMHPGLLRLGDTILYVPKGYAAGRPHALALVLHGAGGDAAEGLALLRPYADRLGLLL